MTSPSQPPVSGDPETLTDVLHAFEQRTVVVEALAAEVTALIAETRSLRSAVTHRPSRRETERKRRIMGLLVALWSLLLIFVHDQHIEYCGPGARTEAEVDRFLDGEEDVDALRRAQQPTVPFLCDAFFPLHSHGKPGEPPSDGHITGLVVYSVLVMGAVAWVVIPGRRTRREEDAEGFERRAHEDVGRTPVP